MSGAAMEEADLLAAEWVLGVLEGPARAEAEARLRDDAAFRAAVEVWERRLAPLARLAPSAPPPSGLWERIAQAAFGDVAPGLRMLQGGAPPRPAPAPPRPSQAGSRRGWRRTATAALVLAACAAAVLFLDQPIPPPAPVLRALLTPPGQAGFVVEQNAAGLSVRPSGPVAVAAGRDLELWALRAGEAVPVSLGVLPATGRLSPAHLPPGTQVLVSLEPRGGSPTGQPTGPVLFAGQLAQ